MSNDFLWNIYLQSIDQWNDFEFENDILEVDVGADAGRIFNVRDAARGHGDPLSGSDHGLFVIRGIDGWAWEDFESRRGFECIDEDHNDFWCFIEGQGSKWDNCKSCLERTGM